MNQNLDFLAQHEVKDEPGVHVRKFLADCRARGITPSPAEVLEQIYSDETLPITMIKAAAGEAASYRHPKLSAQATVPVDGDFAARLDRAIAASRATRPMKVIEAQPVAPKGKSPEEVSAERTGKSFAPMRRF